MRAVINFRCVNVSLKFPIVTCLQYTGPSEVRTMANLKPDGDLADFSAVAFFCKVCEIAP